MRLFYSSVLRAQGILTTRPRSLLSAAKPRQLLSVPTVAPYVPVRVTTTVVASGTATAQDSVVVSGTTASVSPACVGPATPTTTAPECSAESAKGRPSPCKEG